VDDLTDEYMSELPVGNMNPHLPLLLSTGPGDYVIFPEGVVAFARKHGAEAIGIDPDGNVFALREGLQKGKLAWVELTFDPDEKKEKTKNG
jgi:hypothetical protein